MRLNRFFIASLFAAVLAVSCDKDDDGPEEIPVRDRGEQEIDDQEALAEYLDTHFYNYEDFENPSEDFDYSVVIDTIAGANADKTPLSESGLIEKKMEYDGTEYTLFILKVREGEGERPEFTDDIFITYRGELLNREMFDNSVVPVWFNLVWQNNNVAAAIPGFSPVFPEFRTASGYEVNPDNTISWNNDYGIGAVFLPSGLGYFANGKPGIPAYSPLVFTFKLLRMSEADHDGDGIPSWMEDLNEDENIMNDDTDGNGTPNFMDTDDDGDYIPTAEEISINEDGTIEFTDENGSGTPDYLEQYRE